MKVRVISGVCFAALMIGIVWLGGPYLAAFMCLVSGIAYMELSRATNVHTKDCLCNGFEFISILALIAIYVCIYYRLNELYIILVIALMLVVHMIIYVFSFPKYDAKVVINSIFSFIYGPLMLSFILMTRMLILKTDTGFYTIGFFSVWMILISAWASDTFAYFSGVALGKHKITPVLSPKKTVEGCIGGVVGTTICGALYGLILWKNGIILQNYILVFALLGFCGSIAGQIGDLAASGIKRNYNIKDYGKIIPGHGGVMDRFDSVIFTGPLIFLLVQIFIAK